MLMLERTQSAPGYREITDVFSDFWSIAVARDIPKATMFLHRHGQFIELSGNVGLFVPPKSILHWGFSGRDFSWKALLIEGPPPLNTPSEACIFDLIGEKFPDTPSEILALLENLRIKALVAKEEKVTPLALKIKKYIDDCGLESYSLCQMAKDLSCSPGSMSRAFRNCFGVTPVFYRNQLRVFRASLMLVRGAKVSEAGHDVGFHDLGRFNKQFKKKMNAVPRQFIDATG